MRKIKLSSQLLILYTTVTVLSAVVFGLVTYRNYEIVYLGIVQNEMNTYLEAVVDDPKEFENKPYLGYITAYVETNNLKKDVRGAVNTSTNAELLAPNLEIQKEIILAAEAGYFEFLATNGQTYYVGIIKISDISSTITHYLVGVMDSTYVSNIKRTSAQGDVLLSFVGTFVAFAVIIVVGNVILALWSREMTKRIKNLSNQVKKLGETGYQKQIEITGNDEISDLGNNVEQMRLEIEHNERTKQEMFQNLSHDFKTPISVIRSYAEAIEDEISDSSDASIIIEQAGKLEEKVRRLLEYNKLEYIDSTIPLEEVKLKNVIKEVLDDYRIILSKFKVIVKYDDTIFKGLRENWITVVSNILDNATRYAKSKIIIRLKNNKLSIYNDGPPIEQKYISALFKPYEKGTKGQFGLGMSIVQKTVNRFGYRLSVENISGGVVFTIEPQ
ncbi:MAG: HAMP domain-containing sensor histidine kinase [Acholeplasmataceae bacterium]|nr:HAMP domain-containing sensor histidine kinase [Acholeplasmataceae bacterium]MDD4203578.1 HAMP domain-containing sensor histidine kinase [Acholeplasmataceae bacterium]MDD4468320.1 HAMP domain-containing sensor histidine kinase [Acholeplasmataceae bacterium]